MSSSEDLTALKKKLTQNAIQIADAYGIQLDFSNESIHDVELVLGRLHDELKFCKDDDGYVGIALTFAAYIVSVIESNFTAGDWQRDHDTIGPETFPYFWRDKTLFPHGWCLKRHFDGPGDNVAVKYESLVIKAACEQDDLSRQPPMNNRISTRAHVA